MPIVYADTPDQYSMDGYLKSNLDITKRINKEDWDTVCVIDGGEGSGKSVLAQQVAKYVDPSFNVERICFNSEQFKKVVRGASQYQAIVYDEAFGGLSARRSLSAINTSIVSMLVEIRAKRLFVFILLPTFFDLDRYVAIWRSKFLLHVYSDEDFKRGFFTFYNLNRKKTLYMEGKKTYSYNYPRANFHGRFTNHYTVPEAEYRKRKLASMNDTEKDTRKRELDTQSPDAQKLIARTLARYTDMKQREIAKELGLTQASISRFLKSSNNNETKPTPPHIPIHTTYNDKHITVRHRVT